MYRIYCDTCHGRVRLEENRKQAVCESCGRVIQVPKGYSALESSFCFAAEAEGRHDYDTALETYEEIIKGHPNCAYAYWKRALARYQIAYRPTGENTYRLVVHQAKKGSFAREQDVKKALGLAEGQERESYQAEAERIDALQEAVTKRHALGGRVDVVVASGWGRKRDLESAKRITAMLGAAKLQVFCPMMELAGQPGESWEPELYHAYSQAAAVVLVAETAESFTPDLLFDAERFLMLQAGKQRQGKPCGKLYLAYGDLDEYSEIPDVVFDGAEARFQIQAADFATVLTSAVTEAMGKDQELLQEETGGQEDYAYRNLLRQAGLALGNGEFEEAWEAFDDILNINPRESQAWWGLLLCEKECRNEEELILQGEVLEEEAHYRSALAFASEREQQVYRKVAADAAEAARAMEEREKEEQRIEAEKEEERARRKKEIEEEKQRSIRRAEKRKKRRRILTALLFVGILVGGVAGYCSYQSKYGPDSPYGRYHGAMELFQGGQYEEAKEVFTELGEYQDSLGKVEECELQIKALRYAQVLAHEGKLETRRADVSELMAVRDEIPEAEPLLAQYRQEGMDAYYEGRYQAAYEMLRGFGRGEEMVREFVLAWQILCNRGLFVRSEQNTYLIDSQGGIRWYGTLVFPVVDDGSILYCGAALSADGESLGLVDTEGKLYLYGALEGKKLPWSDEQIINVRVTNEAVIALTADGRLLDSRAGRTPVAEHIRVFDLFTKETYPMINGKKMDAYEMKRSGYSVKVEDIVVAVGWDGALYCSSERYRESLMAAGWFEKEWECATGNQNRIAAIDTDQVLWIYDFDSGETRQSSEAYAIAESGSTYKLDKTDLYLPAHTAGYKVIFTGNAAGMVELDQNMPFGEEKGDYKKWLWSLNPPGLIETYGKE